MGGCVDGLQSWRTRGLTAAGATPAQGRSPDASRGGFRDLRGIGTGAGRVRRSRARGEARLRFAFRVGRRCDRHVPTTRPMGWARLPLAAGANMVRLAKPMEVGVASTASHPATTTRRSGAPSRNLVCMSGQPVRQPLRNVRIRGAHDRVPSCARGAESDVVAGLSGASLVLPRPVSPLPRLSKEGGETGWRTPRGNSGRLGETAPRRGPALRGNSGKPGTGNLGETVIRTPLLQHPRGVSL